MYLYADLDLDLYRWGMYVLLRNEANSPKRRFGLGLGLGLTLASLGLTMAHYDELVELDRCLSSWYLKDIAVTNMVWCMACKGRSVGERTLRSGRTLVLLWGRLCRCGGGGQYKYD